LAFSVVTSCQPAPISHSTDNKTFADPPSTPEPSTKPLLLPAVDDTRRPDANKSNAGHAPRKTITLLSDENIVIGELSTKDVHDIVDRHKNAIKLCYTSEFQPHKSLAGNITVKWIINATGGVSRAEATSNAVGDQQVENCIV